MQEIDKFACLVILFRRFEYIETIIHRCSRIGVNKIYFAVDGPRNEEDETSQRHSLNRISRLCRELELDFEFSCLTVNRGIFVNVVTALDWFFEENLFGIVLEDDTIPELEFNNFIRDNVSEFQSSDKILLLAGWRDSNFEPSQLKERILCSYPQIWGWATSREKWAIIRSWFFEDLSRKTDCKSYFSPSYGFWHTGYQRAIAGTLDSWANVLALNFLLGNYKSLVPLTSVIENVGLDKFATNSRVRKSLRFCDVGKLDTPCNYDEWLEKKVYQISFRHIFAPLYSPIVDLFFMGSRRVPPLALLKSASKKGLSGSKLRNSL
jgi:hypothetical protein